MSDPDPHRFDCVCNNLYWNDTPSQTVTLAPLLYSSTQRFTGPTTPVCPGPCLRPFLKKESVPAPMSRSERASERRLIERGGENPRTQRLRGRRHAREQRVLLWRASQSPASARVGLGWGSTRLSVGLLKRRLLEVVSFKWVAR